MPVRGTVKTLTNSSVDILNVIRNNATQNYQEYVPLATADADSIREIGAVIMDFPNLQNEFLSALVNRIGRVLVTSKMYTNPWEVFKKGMLEFGESIEEIFVNIAKPFEYDPDTAESEVFKRVIPDVRSSFHVMNYKEFYKSTIQENDLRQAFLSWDGITDLIARIVNAMYTGANYDEFQTMKYMLAQKILKGQLYPVTIPEVTGSNMKQIVSQIKGVSNEFEFMSESYNLASVKNFSSKDDQFLIVNANFDATMDVEVLASAFNMSKAEFSGHRILIDGFGKLDTARLHDLFKDDPNYNEVSSAEMKALNKIPAVLVDRDWWMVFDNMEQFTEQYNSQGLYWNYFYHVWKTFSTSPFANNALFIPAVPAVTRVSVTPSTGTVAKGSSLQLTAVVETTNFAPQSVTWSSNNASVTVSETGIVTVGKSATGTAKITATSDYDTTKSGSATITVG